MSQDFERFDMKKPPVRTRWFLRPLTFLLSWQDTWYIYPHDCKFAVTKMALATEELYFAHRRKQWVKDR